MLKASNCAAYDAFQAAFIGLRIMVFFWVTIFVTRLELTETLLTRLINGNSSQYVATIKTTQTSF